MNTESAFIRRGPNIFSRGWQWLTEPAAGIQDIGDRRRAKLLSSLLLFLILGLLSNIMFSRSWLFVGAFGFMSIMYALSRTRYHTLSAILAVFFLSFPSFANVLSGAKAYTNDTLTATFMWIALPLVLGSIFFSVRGMLIVSTANVMGLVILPWINPPLTHVLLGGPLGFTILLSAFIIMAMHHRNSLEQDRQGLLEAVRQAEADSIKASRQAEADRAERAATKAVSEQQVRQQLEKKVEEYVAFAKAVAQGDLTRRLTLYDNGAGDGDTLLNTLSENLNQMVQGLAEMIYQTHDIGTSLSNAAMEILAATTGPRSNRPPSHRRR
jgi:hypothetical protein